MKRIILLIFIIVLISSVPSRAEKMRIAIMELKSDSISEKTVKTVSNMLRTELINIGLFMVIERAQIDTILKEQGFQQTGCTDQECVVEMGKLLSAKKILVGEVSTMGKAIMMTIRIVDVEKGVSEFGASEKAESEDNLDNVVHTLAYKLVSHIDKQKNKERPEGEPVTSSGYYLRGFIPGWAQIYSDHPVKGVLFGTAFVASAIWTTIAILNYKKSKNDYDSLGSGQSQDKYDSAYDKYKKDSKIATYSIIGTSLIYIVNWADVLFFTTPGQDKSLGLIKYDNVYVNLNVNCYGLYEKLPSIKTYLSATMRF